MTYKDKIERAYLATYGVTHTLSFDVYLQFNYRGYAETCKRCGVDALTFDEWRMIARKDEKAVSRAV